MEEELEKKQAVDKARLREFDRVLRSYKAGKSSVERRVIASENWWKLRNSAEEDKETSAGGEGFRCVSGWLHNVIVSKHADSMEAYPEPVILPREKDDRAEARTLSAIVPVILEENRFEDVYSESMWQKLKTGTAVYRVIWDSSKLNGMGDIGIERVNLLNIFWEPGVEDIQRSRYVFCTRYEDREELEERYPQYKGEIRAGTFRPSEYSQDDAVDLSGKVLVTDVYYHRLRNGVNTLQFCRYAGDTVLYSTENEGVSTLYEHGRYPFVFDTLFPVEGSPCGYGFIDLCRNAQTRIDLMQTAFVKNTLVGALPRYFMRGDGGVNEQELLDLGKSLVHTDGNLGEDSLRSIEYRPLSGNYIEVLSSAVNELRETSGNTETSTGNISSGVTAASAIAALQEASGKGSRDAIRTSYRAYREIVELCIELIRQFYTLPRQFRITGEDGGEEYISYLSYGIRAKDQGSIGGIELGIRLPVFDVKVEAARKNAYTRLSQNELAMEMYRMGMFAPEMAEQAEMCLDMMEFEGKDEVRRQIRAQRERMRELTVMAELGAKAELVAKLRAENGPQAERGRSEDGAIERGESGAMPEVRERANTAALPG